MTTVLASENALRRVLLEWEADRDLGESERAAEVIASFYSLVAGWFEPWIFEAGVACVDRLHWREAEAPQRQLGVVERAAARKGWPLPMTAVANRSWTEVDELGESALLAWGKEVLRRPCEQDGYSPALVVLESRFGATLVPAELASADELAFEFRGATYAARCERRGDNTWAFPPTHPSARSPVEISVFDSDTCYGIQLAIYAEPWVAAFERADSRQSLGVGRLIQRGWERKDA